MSKKIGLFVLIVALVVVVLGVPASLIVVGVRVLQIQRAQELEEAVKRGHLKAVEEIRARDAKALALAFLEGAERDAESGIAKADEGIVSAEEKIDWAIDEGWNHADEDLALAEEEHRKQKFVAAWKESRTAQGKKAEWPQPGFASPALVEREQYLAKKLEKLMRELRDAQSQQVAATKAIVEECEGKLRRYKERWQKVRAAQGKSTDWPSKNGAATVRGERLDALS